MASVIEWPARKKFAFTIIDDTDNSTVANIKPVYDLLRECGLKTTKTVWVYPSRDRFSGQCLQDDDYRAFISDLVDKGFEIALHNVGSGSFSREEIIKGVELFNQLLGFYPSMQINHAGNPDNIYWGIERYTWMLRGPIRLFYGDKRIYHGTDHSSRHFWGDISKQRIKYIRNHTFNGINTLKYDPKMPYRVKHKDQYSNFWFSSSDGHTVQEFNDLVNLKNITKLENEGGLCIVYTHFASGFVKDSGELNNHFVDNIKLLSGRNGWFAPAGEVLDYLIGRRHPSSVSVGGSYLACLDLRWLIDRVKKRVKTGR